MCVAVGFLKEFHPNGFWVLTAINPDRKGTVTKTFTEAAECEAWIDAQVGKSNLYFMVNQPGGPLTKKATKADVATAPWLHVDIDARVGEPLDQELVRIRAKVEGFTPRPTAVVFSGGGYQAFWRLAEPVDDPEPYNQQLAYLLEGDSCHNVDRIMRLPGTINLPTAKKMERGRTPVETSVLWFEDHVYPITDFTPVGTVADAPVGKPVAVPDLTALDKWGVPDRVKVIIVQGNHPDETKDDTSRSAWLFDVVCNLHRCSVPDETILGIVLDPDYRISESVLDKDSPLRYALRQVRKAHDVAIDFARTKSGAVISCLANVRLALRKLGCTVTHDSFAMRTRVDGTILDDKLLINLWGRVELETGWTPAWDSFNRYLHVLALMSPVHPVCNYLDGIAWDGVSRIDHWLVAYAGAEDTEYVRAVGRLVLVAAVRRVRSPGCKFDEMLVLESAQGMNKSSALACLAVNPEWFTDDLPLGDDSKRQMEAIMGKWIVEAGELAGMRKADTDKLKTFLSRPVDEARLAYGRENTRAARQCVIIGTTNNDKYLKDHTGNRRFWPVAVKAFDLESMERDRDQLWAEAAHYEAQGAAVRLDPRLYPNAGAEQEKRYDKHEYLGLLEELLADIEYGQIPTKDVRLSLDLYRVNAQQNKDMGRAMKALGWDRVKARIDGRLEYVYRRGDTPGWPVLRYIDGEFLVDGDEAFEYPLRRT